MMEEEMEKYRELLVKFFDGDISDDEIEELKSLLEESAEYRRIFDKKNQLWQESGIQTKLEYYKADEGWEKITSRLGIVGSGNKSVIVINTLRLRLMLAASLVACMVAIGAVALWLSGKQTPVETIIASTTISTEEGDKAYIYLPDSTRVFINSGSYLKYDVNYNISERVVELSGEAYFDVRTNPQKPFKVEVKGMTVTATGTKFNVLSYSTENRIETTLEEGEIQVNIEGHDVLDISSGQQVIYYPKSKKAVIADVVTETYTSWRENMLRLIDTPLEEALRKIGRRYNVLFEIRNSDLLDLKYTATFIDEPIEEVMGMLKTVSPITYQIYYRTNINDKQYLKPKIVIRKIKTI